MVEGLTTLGSRAAAEFTAPRLQNQTDTIKINVIRPHWL